MNNTPTNLLKQSKDVVHTVDDKNKPVPKRISMPQQGGAVYGRFLDADSGPALHRTKVQGQMNGNRPFKSSLLAHNGQGWRANFNAGEAESIRDTNAESYWSLLMDSPSLISVKVRRDPNDVSQLSYGEIIAEEYTDTLTEWPDFFYNVLLHSIELFTFGKGPMVWVDPFDWRPRAYKIGNVLLSPRISSAVGDIEIVFVRDEITSSDLVRKLQAGDVSKTAGWNLDAIRTLMRKHYITNDFVTDEDYQRSPVESLMQAIKNHDQMLPFWDVEPLKIVHLFIKQVVSQKISHFIMQDSRDVSEYLLEANDVIDDMQNTLCMFTSSIGDGYMASIRGLGQKMFPHIEVSNRTICSTIDSARISGSMVVTGGKPSDNTLIVNGPVVRLPVGSTAIQSSFTPKLDQMIMVRTMLQQILNNTHGVYKKAIEYPGAPERTRAEVVIEAENQAKFSNFAIVLYYTHWDRCHREIFRRLTLAGYPANHPGAKEAQDFIKRCVDRGVPREYLKPERCRIRSMRAIGAGSPAVRKIVTQEILNVSGMFRTEQGRVNALREYLAARTGGENVDRFEPVMTQKEIITTEHKIAQLETNDMNEGVAMNVGADEPHMIHLQVHMAAVQGMVSQVMEGIKSGQPPELKSVMSILSVTLPHIGETLQNASRDPRNKQEVKRYGEAFDELMAFADSVEKELAKQDEEDMQQQQAQLEEMQSQMQSQPDPELQIKIEKMRGELAIKAESAKKQAEIRAWKTQQDASLKEFKVREEVRRKDIEQSATNPRMI